MPVPSEPIILNRPERSFSVPMGKGPARLQMHFSIEKDGGHYMCISIPPLDLDLPIPNRITVMKKFTEEVGAFINDLADAYPKAILANWQERMEAICRKPH